MPGITSQEDNKMAENTHEFYDEEIDEESLIKSVAKPAVMQVMQCMTKNFPKNV
jgi:hypothetical protein